MLLHQFCPTQFAYVEQEKYYAWLVQIGINTFVFPLLTVILLWKLEFAQSIYLKTQRERYAPYIATILFCFWIFYVFYKTQSAPPIIISFLFGNFICISLLFLINIFYKISMHGMAIGSLLGIQMAGAFGDCHNYTGVFIALGISAIVIPARLGKEEHNKMQIVLAFILGLLTQLICWGVFK